MRMSRCQPFPCAFRRRSPRPAAALLVAGMLPATAQAAPLAARTTADHRDATVVSLRVTPTPAVVQIGSRTVDGTLVAGLPGRRTTHFSMVGVTWERASGRDVSVEVRTRGADGWSDWTRLEVDPDNDASGTRAGTVPLWVDDATGVATRVRSADTPPQGVKVVLVDPGTAPAGATTSADRTAAATTDGSPAYTPMPSMITRAQWGARRQQRLRLPALRLGDAGRDLPPHRRQQQLRAQRLAGDRPLDAGVPHAGPWLVRHRLQLPGRQVRPDLRGTQRRRADPGPRRPRRQLQREHLRHGRLHDRQPRQGAPDHGDEERDGEARRLEARHELPVGQGHLRDRRPPPEPHRRPPRRLQRRHPAGHGDRVPGSLRLRLDEGERRTARPRRGVHP